MLALTVCLEMLSGYGGDRAEKPEGPTPVESAEPGTDSGEERVEGAFTLEDCYLYVYPAAEHESYATKWIKMTGEGEVLESSAVEGGEVLVPACRDYRDVAEVYDVIQYALDEDAGRLNSVYTEIRNAEDDSVAYYTLVEMNYEASCQPETDPTDVILAGLVAEGAELLVVFDRG